MKYIKPVNQISENLQSFQEVSCAQKEVLPSHKLQDNAYEQQNLFGSKQDNPTQRNCQSQLSHPSLSPIEQECQEKLIEGKKQNSTEDLKYL